MADGLVDDRFASLWQDPTSRRSFLRLAGLGASSLTFSSALASCTADRPTDVAGGPSGALSAALATSFGSLDGADMNTPATVVLAHVVYETLYAFPEVPPQDRVTPVLATGLPRQVDRTTYLIQLRPNTKFHNGVALTADDVVFSIKRIMDPKTAPLIANYFTIFKDVVVAGDAAVEIRLHTPTSLLAERLSMVKILSRSTVEKNPAALKLRPVGTGPYQIVSASSDQKAALKRFEDYSGPLDLSINEVTMHIVRDGNARVAGLRSGQYNIIEDVPASSFASLAKGGSGIRAEAVSSGACTLALFNCSKAPFKDVRVRRALLYALDRDAINKNCFFGTGEPAWSGIQRSHPEYVEPQTVYRYDPRLAKRLLAEAGFSGRSAKVNLLLANEYPYLASQLPLIEQNLNDAGFDVNITPGPSTSLFPQVTDGSYDVFFGFGDPTLFSPKLEFQLRWFYQGTFPTAFVYWTGASMQRASDLLDQVLVVADPAERKRLLKETLDLVQAEVPLARLHFRKQLTGWSDQLSGYEPLPSPGVKLDGVRLG